MAGRQEQIGLIEGLVSDGLSMVDLRSEEYDQVAGRVVAGYALENDDETLMVGEYSGAIENIVSSITAEPGVESDTMAITAMRGGVSAAMALSHIQDERKIPDGYDAEDLLNVAQVTHGSTYTVTPGLESFDDQNLGSTIQFTAAFNMMAVHQDAFVEAFMPTIVIPHNVSGLGVTIDIPVLVTDYDRTPGATRKNGFDNRKSLLLAYDDTSLLKLDINKLLPSVSLDKDGVLDTEIKYSDSSRGETVDVAPILFNKTIADYLEITQLDSQLAKSLRDNTDALDRTLELNKIFIQITDPADSTKVDIIGFEMKSVPYHNFTYTTQHHDKDLALSMSDATISINTSKTKMRLTSGLNEVSGILANLPEDHTIDLKFTLNGNANTQTAAIVVYASDISVVAVKGPDGVVLTDTDPNKISIMKVFDTVKLRSYILDSYLTNSNLRTRGRQLDSDQYKMIIPVPLKTGWTKVIPTKATATTSAGNSAINTKINANGIVMEQEGVEVLLNHLTDLKEKRDDGSLKTSKFIGYSDKAVIPTYINKTIDLKVSLNTFKSSEKESDIKSTLANIIKNAIITMDHESKFGRATRFLYGPSAKIHVTIGTDLILASYLGSTIDVGSNYVCNVVSTYNPAMDGRIVIRFGESPGVKNSELTPLSSGATIFSPEVVVVTDKSSKPGTANVSEIHTQPRYLHYMQVPIALDINVLGLDDVITSRPLQVSSV